MDAPLRTDSPLASSRAEAVLNTTLDPPILQKAMELVQAGWDGVSLELFHPSAVDPNLLQRYAVTFRKEDFAKIQQVTKDLLGKTNFQRRQAEIINPFLSSSLEQSLESLRRHLVGLANPYAVIHICEVINIFCSEPLDPSNERSVLAHYEDPKLDPETKQRLKNFICELIKKTQNIKDPDIQTRFIEKIQADLKEFNKTLCKNNLVILEEFAEWEDLETLFKISVFLALKDVDYKKLINHIRKDGVTEVRDFVDDLDRVSPIKNTAKEELGLQKYRYNLDTLLGDIVERKPRKKEGIRTYWNYSEDFFINKTFYLAVPHGECFSGTILKCKKISSGNFIFHLQDLSEIHVSQVGEVTVIKSHVTHKLFTAILNGAFAPGDIFTLEHSSYTKNKHFILPGPYMLLQPKEIKPTLANVFEHYFECYLAHPQTKKKL